MTLPADGLSNVNYNPFPAGDYTTIDGIIDEVQILSSLQRPKKVRALDDSIQVFKENKVMLANIYIIVIPPVRCILHACKE